MFLACVSNFGFRFILVTLYITSFLISKAKAVPLHAMKALKGKGGINPTHSRTPH
jgi:hypothetical protein